MSITPELWVQKFGYSGILGPFLIAKNYSYRETNNEKHPHTRRLHISFKHRNHSFPLKNRSSLREYRCNYYWWWFWPLLEKKWPVVRSSGPWYHDCWHTGLGLILLEALDINLSRPTWSVYACLNAGPTVFNLLPPDIRLSHSMDIFKRHPKTHLFTTPIVCPPPSAFVSKYIIGAI